MHKKARVKSRVAEVLKDIEGMAYGRTTISAGQAAHVTRQS
jgi:hypothetical protein